MCILFDMIYEFDYDEPERPGLFFTIIILSIIFVIVGFILLLTMTFTPLAIIIHLITLVVIIFHCNKAYLYLAEQIKEAFDKSKE